jgi:hypothetical protein
MPAEVTTRAARMPRRARYLVPKGLPRRRELLAVCAVVLFIAHLLFAQLTILIAVFCYLLGKVTRWRPAWLLGPALAGAVWTLAVGPATAAAGFTAGPAQIVDYLTASGHFLHLGPAFAGLSSWLPRQFPLALLAGPAEAGLASWLSWLHTDEWNMPPSRPGLFVVTRRAAAARSIRTGGVVTRDGACLGIAPGSGKRIALSWSEASYGVLACGATAQDVQTTSFQLIQAALRRRKPVVVIDFTAEGVRGRLAAACRSAGVSLQVFGGGGGGGGRPDGGQPDGGQRAVYEPFRYGDPGQRAELVTAMLTWDGPASQHRRSCTAYLTDVFELLDAVPGDPRVPVLDEVIHLLDPAALRARAAHVPAGYPRRAVLVERAEVSARLVSAEPGIVAALSRQLRAFRASPAGRWLGQPVGAQLSGIELTATVSGRGAALFCLGGPGPTAGLSGAAAGLSGTAAGLSGATAGLSGAAAGPAVPVDGPSAATAAPEALAMLSRLVCQDLLRLAANLRVAGGHGDGVIWLAGCQAIPERTFADLVAAGPTAGLAVLATTTSAAAACALAEHTNALVVHRLTDPSAARGLAAAVAPRLQAPGAGVPAAGVLGGPAAGVLGGPGAGLPGGPAVGVEAPPVVTADDLLTLGEDEFVLAVRSPRRLVRRGLAVRARA